MLYLVLADSELERVPREIANHPVIQHHARKRGRRPTELILNSSRHHPAMRKLPQQERRGRPDIAHFSLLQALDSPANMENQLRVYVHTRNDLIIKIDRETKLPRSYDRFEGLMEQLFLVGSVPPDKPLLKLERGSLKDLVKRISPSRVLVFSEEAPRKRLSELFSGGEERVCAIVGGFPYGGFLSRVEEIASEMVSLYPAPLTAPLTISRVLAAYESARGIM